MAVLKEIAAVVTLGVVSFVIGFGLWFGWKWAAFFFTTVVCK